MHHLQIYKIFISYQIFSLSSTFYWFRSYMPGVTLWCACDIYFKKILPNQISASTSLEDTFCVIEVSDFAQQIAGKYLNTQCFRYDWVPH